MDATCVAKHVPDLGARDGSVEGEGMVDDLASASADQLVMRDSRGIRGRTAWEGRGQRSCSEASPLLPLPYFYGGSMGGDLAHGGAGLLERQAAGAAGFDLSAPVQAEVPAGFGQQRGCCIYTESHLWSHSTTVNSSSCWH